MANTYTFTQEDLDTFVVNAKCSSSLLADTYVKLKKIQDLSAEDKLYELKTLNFLIFCLEDLVLTSDCLTEDQIQDIVEKIDKLVCSCC